MVVVDKWRGEEVEEREVLGAHEEAVEERAEEEGEGEGEEREVE